jgi:protein subunit release factor B/uncharacterized protein (UPF0248 family)
MLYHSRTLTLMIGYSVFVMSSSITMMMKIIIMQQHNNLQRQLFVCSFTTTVPMIRRRFNNKNHQIFSRLYHHRSNNQEENISNLFLLSRKGSGSRTTRLFSSSNNDNDDDTTTSTVTTTLVRPMENIYREWTLEQDQLLWSNSSGKNKNKSNAELAVLLGRGMRGVEQRLLKLKDVESSVYQRMFVKNNNNQNNKSYDDDDESEKDNNGNSSNSNSKSITRNKKLIPVSEVLRRIEWDYQLNENDFYILHYDRVDDTIVTSSLTASNSNIDSGETSLIKALPEHRIMAIKYKERIVWDRRQNRKYDIVFNAPGIIDVIQTYEEWETKCNERLQMSRIMQNEWNERWMDLLESSETKKERLFQLTKDLLVVSSDAGSGSGSNDDSSESQIIHTKQKVDSYLPSIIDLFREEDFFSTATTTTTTIEATTEQNDDDLQMPDYPPSSAKTNCNGRLVSLLDELSEWVASPYWTDFDNDDDYTEIDDKDNNNEEQKILREILLQKISSTMDRLEGNKYSVKEKMQQSLKSKKKQKVSQQQQAASRLNNIQLNDNDIEESFVRGSGAGGQKVNKTSNCVALLHTPTGVRVDCQDTRSLQQNRKIARKRLKEKLDLFWNGSNSKQSMKQVQASKKKKKTKLKNKSRLKEKKLSKKQQLLLQLEEKEEEEDEEEKQFNE